MLVTEMETLARLGPRPAPSDVSLIKAQNDLDDAIIMLSDIEHSEDEHERAYERLEQRGLLDGLDAALRTNVAAAKLLAAQCKVYVV